MWEIQETQHGSLGGKIPWSRRKWQPTPIFLPGKSREQRSLGATVHGVTKSWTRLKRLCLLTCIAALQRGVSLCRTAKLISYKFAYILPSWASLPPPPPPLPSRPSQNTELPVLCSRRPLASCDMHTRQSTCIGPNLPVHPHNPVYTSILYNCSEL